jgi:hypothetical protein
MRYQICLCDFLREEKWYPRTESNRDPLFRKQLLYPFELRGQAVIRIQDSNLGGVDKQPQRWKSFTRKYSTERSNEV